MIAPEVKEAWNIAQHEWGWSKRLANAYVGAEWQRRKAEWAKNHAIWLPSSQCFPCTVAGTIDERHEWTDAQWRESVLEELREP